MTAPDDAAAFLRSVTELGQRIFAAAACSLAVLEPDEEHLVFRAASGAGAAEVVGLRLPVSRGLAGWAVSAGQPIAVHDVRVDPRFARDVAETTGYVPESILAMPIDTAEGTVGVIEVLDRTPAAERDDMALLALLAAHAGRALELAAAVPRPAQAPDPATVLARIAALGLPEQRAAAALLAEFVSYVGRRGGPAGVG